MNREAARGEVSSSTSTAMRLVKATLCLVPLWAGLLFLGSERVHDAATRWFGVGGGSHLVVRYEYSSRHVVFALQLGLLVAAIIVVFVWGVLGDVRASRSKKGTDQRSTAHGDPIRVGAAAPGHGPGTRALQALGILVIVGFPVWLVYEGLTDIVAIEVTRSGAIDFLSRTKRESFPVTSIVRVEGSTSQGWIGYPVIADRTLHRVELAFADANAKEVVRAIEVWGRGDNSLTTLVSRLEELNPRLDASKFWSWRPGGPARGPESLSALDYVHVCSGAGREQAAPYQQGSGERHPLLVFYRRAADTHYFQFMGLPASWLPESDRVSETELVACVTPAERRKAKDCSFRSGNVVELHDTRFDFSLHEAQTGRVLAQTRLDVKAGECPASRMFQKQREIEDADPALAIVEFARPYVQP